MTFSHKIDDLTDAVATFKSHYNDRLNALEYIHEKVNTMTDIMTKTTQKMTQLDAAAKRPMTDQKAAHTPFHSAEQHHFTQFVRKGMDMNLECKSLSADGNQGGGYLIPAASMELIRQKLTHLSVIRQLAMVTTISTDSLELLVEKSGASVGWVTETQDRAETDTPELVKIRIPTHQIYAKPKVSQKILDDAQIDVESWIAEKIAQGMASTENLAFLKGDGQGKPKGILAYDTCPLGQAQWGKIETLTTGKNGGIENPEALITLLHSLKPQYLPGASWLMSRSAAAAIRSLTDHKNGQSLWQQSLAASMPNTLLGYPVVFSDDMPELSADQGSASVIFGNFKDAYQIVDRAQVSILRDPYTAKPYVEFYATKRVGGDVVNFDAIRILNFSS